MTGVQTCALPISEGFAINPKAKFIHLSYSDDLARDNSRGVQEILREPSYRRLFPDAMPTSVNTRKWFTKAGGGLYAVSSAGQVTGFGAGFVDKDEDEELGDEVAAITSEGDEFGGAIVIDDPIKPDDARSEQIREKVNQKFETTIRNRVNSRKTPIIIIIGVFRLLTRFRMVVSNFWFTFSRICSLRASSGLIGSSMTIAPPNSSPSEVMAATSSPNSSSSSLSTKPAPKPVTCPADETA